jgi:hypothetical protein
MGNLSLSEYISKPEVKMKIKGVFLAAILTAVLCFSGNLLAYSGGSGTASDPYKIATADDLLELAANTGDYDKHFVLTADIDLDPNLPGRQVFTTAVIAPDIDNSNADYDFDGTAFSAVFDGAGHKIINLTIDTNGVGNDFLGLFGYVSSGEIKNLGIENVFITGGFESQCLGGLVGYIGGSINNCYSTGIITGGDSSQYLGGLAGRNWGGTISSCYSTSDVTGGYKSGSLGGLIGDNSLYAVVSNCYATGAVTVGNESGGLGGLAGFNGVFSTISNCYSAGAVTSGNGSQYLGGLVGYNMENISNCHSTGTVTGGDNSTILGGLVGHNQAGHISDCYSTDIVSGGDSSQSLGGLLGDNEGDINNCYSTGDVNDGNEAGPLGGLVGINQGNINNCHSSGNIIVKDFSGNIGGLVGDNGGNISNCCSTGAVSCYSTSDATCYPTDPFFGYSFWSIGGLVGDNEGNITLCDSTGAVTSGCRSYYVGGLVGYNSYYGNIGNCYSTGNVISGDNSYYLGGLVGYSYDLYCDTYSSIRSCYSTGTITSGNGSQGLGGLVGYSDICVVIGNCYFLDVAGSNNGYGTPLTDGKMKQQANFIGWDFVNETINGTEDIWSINEGIDYPKLTWQSIPTQQTGNLQVTLGPAGAVLAGAQWNVDGGTWQNSAATVTGLSVGSHTVNYNSVTGWTAPASEQVTITNGQTNSISRNYTQQTSQAPQFGSLNGKNVKISLKDVYGADVTFSLTGGGYGEVIGGANFDQIILYGTGEKSQLTISTKGKTETSVGDIIVNGSLKGIAAKTTDLRGNITVHGGLGMLELDDVDSDHTITIGSSSNPKAGVLMKFDEVNDLRIDSDTPIKILMCTQWLDNDANKDYIKAPSLGTLQVKGDSKRGIPGDFEADLDLDGESVTGAVLTNAKIAGSLGENTWEIMGDARTIYIKGQIDNWELYVKNKINSLKVGEVNMANIDADTINSLQAVCWLSGTIDANSINTLNVSGDKRASVRGDFNADITLAGNGVAANKNTLGNAKIAGKITGGTWDIIGNGGTIQVGSSPQGSGWVSDFSGDVRTLKVAGYTDVNGAKVSGDLCVDWSSNTLKSLSVAGSVIDSNMTLSQEVDLKLFALGKMSVTKWIDGSRITSVGNIDSITTGGIRDSSCFAGDINEVYVDDGDGDGVLDLPNPPDANDLGDATIGGFVVKGIKSSVDNRTIVDSFINSNIVVRRFNSVLLTYPQYDNGGTDFGLAADYFKKVTVKDPNGVMSYSNLGEPNDLRPRAGDAVIRVK